MKHIPVVLCLYFIAVGKQLTARLIPKENSLINYTTIYFEEEVKSKAVEYELFLFTDSLHTDPLLEVKKAKNYLPAFWLKDLNWSTRYFWKVMAYNKDHEEIGVSVLHAFNTMGFLYQNYDEIKVDVKTNKEDKNNGGLIGIDYTRSFYNRSGKPVWTMPFIDKLVNETTQIRDMKVTKDNTITFLTLHAAVEIDYDGNVLWRAPYPLIINSDTISYHHDFKKTPRNTYMVLGEKRVARKITGTYSKEALEKELNVKYINGVPHRRAVISILLEFDKNGKVIWYWDANDYLKDEDLNYKKTPTGLPNFSTHANAFGENVEGTKVYVGFRDLSRLVRIDKKTKKVESSYGERYPSGDAEFANDVFKNQHDANVTRRNTILILNNNGAFDYTGISSVIELNEKITLSGGPIAWKFDLNFDTLSKGKALNGGNVIELPNGNLLVCAGALNRIFEVTRSKEIVWDAFLFSRGKKDTLWQAFSQYRCSWTDGIKRYYFIPLLEGVISKGTKKEVELSVHNTGNVNDSYVVEVIAANNELVYTTTIKDVRPGAVSSKMLIFKIKDSETRPIVVVKSVNSDLKTNLLIN
jgi:hypothetical protein